MSIVAECIIKAFGSIKVSSARNVGARHIIGYRANGNGNVRNVDFAPRYEVEP
jgi:hypothetical protein